MPELGDDVGGGRLHRERLLALMETHGIPNANRLARFAGLDKGTSYNAVDRPNRIVKADTLYSLARAFGVSTDYLLGLTDRPDPYPPPSEGPRDDARAPRV